MTTTTNVFFVCDCSGSMAGPNEVTMRRLIGENLDVLAANEPSQRFDVQLCPFSDSVRLNQPYAASELRRRPELVSQVSTNHPFGGGTALLDAIGRCLEEAEKLKGPSLVMVFTDGMENNSRLWNPIRLRAMVERIEKTGNLTLTVAGPEQVGGYMQRLGLKAENFRKWDGTERELRAVAIDTKRGLETYVTERGKGSTSVGRFYADPDKLTPAGIKAFTAEVKPKDIRIVPRSLAGRTTADFYGKDFQQGKHFYELVKAEYVQDGKDIIIFIKDQQEYRIGNRAARALLGLPETGRIRLVPKDHSAKYAIFIRSESVNRKTVAGQQFLTVEN